MYTVSQETRKTQIKCITKWRVTFNNVLVGLIQKYIFMFSHKYVQTGATFQNGVDYFDGSSGLIERRPTPYHSGSSLQERRPTPHHSVSGLIERKQTPYHSGSSLLERRPTPYHEPACDTTPYYERQHCTKYITRPEKHEPDYDSEYEQLMKKGMYKT